MDSATTIGHASASPSNDARVEAVGSSSTQVSSSRGRGRIGKKGVTIVPWTWWCYCSVGLLTIIAGIVVIAVAVVVVVAAAVAAIIMSSLVVVVVVVMLSVTASDGTVTVEVIRGCRGVAVDGCSRGVGGRAQDRTGLG